jgi:hypothetical protein
MANRATLLAATTVLAMMSIDGRSEVQSNFGSTHHAPIVKAPTAGQMLKDRLPVVKPEQTYQFTLNAFRITDTRAPHNDTDYVAMAISVEGDRAITAPTKFMENVNNGMHHVSQSIHVTVKREQKVAFSYAIINYNQNYLLMEESLPLLAAKAASDAVARARKEVPGIIEIDPRTANRVGQRAGGWVIGGGAGLFPIIDCDGSVAAGDHVFTGAGLAWRTNTGRVVSATDENAGTDSPVGCGGNSRYYVTWSISGPAQNSSASRGASGGQHGTVISRHQVQK